MALKMQEGRTRLRHRRWVAGKDREIELRLQQALVCLLDHYSGYLLLQLLRSFRRAHAPVLNTTHCVKSIHYICIYQLVTKRHAFALAPDSLDKRIAALHGFDNARLAALQP